MKVSSRDLAAATGLFAAACAVFWLSPVQHRSDSRYTLLVTETLLRTGRLSLDERVVGAPGAHATYNLERAGGSVHFTPPAGGAVFSIPFVLALRPFGLSAIDEDGRYDAAGEFGAQRLIASVLMAALAMLFYRTARLLLPVGASMAAAGLAALGTQVWSTASRALWSDTWAIALLGYVVFRLAALEIRGRPIHPAALATLLAAVFFARPTGAGHVLVVTAHVGWWHRRLLRGLVLTGLAWLGAFVGLSWLVYGKPVPSYYRFWGLGTSAGWLPLATTLVSPSRGLLTCVPLVPAVLYLVARFGRALDPPARRLVPTALAGIAAQLAVFALWHVWWAGHSYGARFMTGAVPWIALLAVLAGRALVDARRGAVAGVPRASRVELAVVLLLAAASVFIQARGALAQSTQRWNVRPTNVDADPARVWDWRYPQWLAGLVPLPGREVRPLGLGQTLVLHEAAADAYLREGWSWPEPELRWIDESAARLEFALDADGPLMLRARLRRPPGLAAGPTVTVDFNGRSVATWTLDDDAPMDFAAPIDGDARGANVLRLRTGDVAGPAARRGDERDLRAGVYWLRVDRHRSVPVGRPIAFGSSEGDAYAGAGWGAGEGEYRWTVASRAELLLAGDPLPPAVLRFEAHAYPVSTRGDGQRVFVAVNDALAATLALRGGDAVVSAVPLAAGLPRLGRVALELPDLVAATPDGDARRLGVALHWLRLDPFPRLSLGRPVALAAAESAAFLGQGWAERERGLRWTVGTSAELFFAADPQGPRRLVLVLDAFLHRGLPAQRLRFDLNGESLPEVTIAEPGRRPVELAIPPGVLADHNVLRLLLPDARSPASLGVSRDARVLGVRVQALELR